ncbi:MAG TPA: PP2C family protein-serine/threonine phosphatase [Treponemataceae bacterium]|jgi:serine phosphatase RsbU (regulator of sigma subunit)|nr:PP2C family protein-serine/threonine phosphatase [Treponemataceae bacterium]
MNLLVFSYILSVFLFLFSYYLDARGEKDGGTFIGLTMVSAFATLFVALTAHLLYTDNPWIALISFRAALACGSLLSLFLARYALMIPYNVKSKLASTVGMVLFLAGLYASFAGVGPVSWTREAGFAFSSRALPGGIDGLSAFVGVFAVGIPAFTILSLIVRAARLRSRIYRQRLLFVALSLAVGIGVTYLLWRFSHTFFWALPLVPFGAALMLVLVYQSVSMTTIYDRSLIIASVINFAVLTLIFSLLAALVTAALMEIVSAPLLVIVCLVAVAVALLAVRSRASSRLRRYVRVGSDYAADLESGLDSIDYTAGGNEVVEKTVALLDQYVECASVQILVSDDKGTLATVHSTTGSKASIAIDDPGIEFLLNRNDSVVMKTQVITNHIYADEKADLMKVFDAGQADAFILIREGRRVVGLIMLGPKKRGADYTEYDFAVLSKLYSNFFLVMYYLKNIANESVVLTVDREIEFSGQIITSIQESIDRIAHPKVDVDFITQSARKLGGDFIDFIKLADDKYLFVMGDVSGKGLNASMSMVILKSVIRTFLTETGDFKQLVVKVNGFIKNNLPKGTFFAGVFGLIDFTANTLYYFNCGIPVMLLYTAAYNNAIEIQGEGRVLGFVRDVSRYLKVKKIALNPQDILLLTTDGLVDSTNLRGERFGKDRVQRLLMDNRTYPAGRIARFVCESLSGFVSRELEDDITVLVFKYLSK